MKKAIPNLLTLSNLFCGCIGIVCAFGQRLEWAGYLIGIAAVFDFFDGFAARILNVKSELGKQLDSLADMVTFGVLPGIIMFQLLAISLSDYFTPINEKEFTNVLLESIGLLLPLFAALRLAKFNIDENQTTTFIGMPTPSVAIFMGSLPIILGSYGVDFYHIINKEHITTGLELTTSKLTIVKLLQNYAVLIGTALFLSLFMVAPVPMLALKFKGFSWKENKKIYTFLLVCLLACLLAVFPMILNVKSGLELGFAVIPLIIVFYALYSLLSNFASNKK